MKIKQALILCAGFGTRMGKIGKVLPKPLWPIGSKTLLEHQIESLNLVGIRKVYINTHHQAEKIREFVLDKNLPVEIIFEKEILDVGGAVQNLVNLGKLGWTVIMNSDQLIQDFEGLFIQLNKSINDNTIGALAVNELGENERYNRLKVENDELKKIIPYGEHSLRDIFTYSGASVLNLDKFTRDKNISNKNFFDLLFKHKDDKAIKITPISKMRFYDLGKIEKYISYIRESEKLDSCFGTDVFKYKIGNIYNFSSSEWGNDVPAGSIILDGEKIFLDHRSLTFQGVVDEF